MPERVRNAWQKVLDKWNTFNTGQKVRISITAAALLIALAATIYLTTRPKWVVLIRDKSAAETGQIQNALTDAGIASKIVNNATGVAVREEFKDQATIAISENPAVVGIDFTFEDALAASGMGATESIKTKAFEAQSKSELNRRLGLFEWVNYASADIVFPEDDGFFVTSKDTPTASVFVNVKWTPDEAQANAMARMVSRSVKRLSMDDIEIVDQRGNTIYSGLLKSMGNGGGSQYDMQRLRENQLDAKVRTILSPIFAEVRTVPNVKMDWVKSNKTEKAYAPPVADSTGGGVLSSMTEKSNVTNGSVDEAPGTDTNDQATADYQTGNPQSSTASSSSNSLNYIWNEVVTTTEGDVGSVIYNESSLMVGVYNYKHFYQKYMEDNNLLGGQRWEDFCANTAETPIDIRQEIIDSLKVGTGIDNLVVLGYEVPVFHDYVPEPVKIEQYIIFGILALLILLLAYGLIRKTQPDEVIELEPELSVEDLLVSTQLEEAKEEEIVENEREQLRAIAVAESETRILLEKFISEKPEAVASLLRNWLNDEWE